MKSFSIWAIALFVSVMSCFARAESGTPMFDAGDGLDPMIQPDAAQPRESGWSAAGRISYSNPNSELSLAKTFPKAGEYVVQFSLIRPEVDLTEINTPVIFCEALIEWTIAGNTTSRRVSVGNGVSVAGVAESVRIVAKDDSGGTIDLFQYLVKMTVAPGTRPNNGYPPQLVRASYSRFQIAPGGSAVRRVPQDAGVRSVNVEGTGATVDMLCGLGTVLKQYVTTGTQPGLYVPLAPSTVAIRISNAGGAPINVALSFGIDG